MKKKLDRRAAELNRLYDKLNGLEPGTEEYKKVMEEVIKIEGAIHEHEMAKSNKIDLTIKIVGIAATTVALPLIKYGLNYLMVGRIGKIEQMETFTSSAGRSMIPGMYEKF